MMEREREGEWVLEKEKLPGRLEEGRNIKYQLGRSEGCAKALTV